jgi:hypothetical protein
MRSLRYCNVVLTVIAVLLTLNLWTAWTTTPGGSLMSIAGDAHAQNGIPNAGAQRKAMIDELKKITTEINGLESTLKSSTLKVKVEGGTGGE